MIGAGIVGFAVYMVGVFVSPRNKSDADLDWSWPVAAVLHLKGKLK